MTDRKLDGNSYNTMAELLEMLKSQAPHIFTEGKLNSEKLKAALSETLESDTEHYEHNWAGKSDCFKKGKDDYELRAGIKDCEDLLAQLRRYDN